MTLSDTKLRSTHGKPYSGPQEVSDADGLSARISPSGVIRFQYRYRWELKVQLTLAQKQFTYQRFDAADMNTPLKPWTLFVSDISLDANDVTVSLTIKNPLNANIGLLYNVEEFTGLQNA